MNTILTRLNQINRTAILVMLAIFGVLAFLFWDNLLGIGYFLFSFASVAIFFKVIIEFLRHFGNLEGHRFEKKLFFVSLLFCIVFLALQSVYFYNVTDTPFAPDASDELGYHSDGMDIAEIFRSGSLDASEVLYKWNYSDSGFPTFVGMVYTVISSVFFMRLVNAIMLSLIGVYVFRITKTLTDSNTAKLAALMVVFFPIFQWYTGNVLKETILMLLILVSLDKIILIPQGKINIKNMIILFATITLLFFFRTAVAGIMSSTLVLALLLTLKKGRARELVLGAFVIATVVFSVFILGETETINSTIEQSTSIFEARQQAIIQKGHSFGSIISLPIGLASVIVAPFPSYVKIPIILNPYHIHGKWYLSGGAFIWNCFALFFLLAVFMAIKRKLSGSLPLLFFSFSYWFVLAVAGLFTSIRYQLPAMPIALIFSAVAIAKLSNKQLRFWYLYMLLIIPIIIIWNYIQIKGRGLI